MMKNNYIVTLAIFTFCIGIGNFSKAQDSKPSFLEYVFKSPWIVEGGFSHVANNGVVSPFTIDMKKSKYHNLNRVKNYYPLRLAAEKYLFANSEKNGLKGLSLQGVVALQGFAPIAFGAADLNIKYHFNKLMGDASYAKWLDPYVLGGIGLTNLSWYDVYTDVQAKKWPPTGYQYPVALEFERDRFLSIQAGLGSNFWINEVVGINLQAEGKFHWLERTARNKKTEGTNYTQYSVGLVFKIGRCKEAPKVEEPKKPVSNYKRSKEEEDALIHLREHLNK